MPHSPLTVPSRRSSLNPNIASPVGLKSPLQPPVEERPPLRACDVAEEYFKKELALHEGITGAATAGTLVFIHDQCYGHRFSRPRTSKTNLSLIVERPERILAAVLGISTAYVRLGDRHCDGHNPPHPYDAPPERIPFKIRKTSRAVDLASTVVANVHGLKWMEELKSLCLDAERKLASTGRELVREANLPGQPPKREFHETDLYLCSESLNAMQGALGGVLDAVDAVFQGASMRTGPSRAFVCIRPPGHHCSDDYPSGFCWINNVHVGIEHAVLQHGLTHAAIIDFDLHHGDGSQSITWARNKKVGSLPKNTPHWKKTSVGYFSLHDINSYPCEEGDDSKIQAASLCIDNAHGQTIWNIHLEGWKTMDEFWAIYEQKYLTLIEKTRQYLKHHTKRLRATPNHPPPKAAIFLSAGFDASEWETPGMQRHGSNVPTEFYARFTRDVVRLAQEEDTGVEGRIISVLEGGYSDRALTSGILSHLSGLTDGQVISNEPLRKGLSLDLRRQTNGVGLSDEEMVGSGARSETIVAYDPRWWQDVRLSELENLVNPPQMVVPKKTRTGPPPNFSSPTQSFTAKVVDPSKIRSSTGRFSSASPSRAPTPPPPDVDWATASHALSKLLIPTTRQTRSCKPEELAETKVKKEKPLPNLTSVHVDPSGRQLRGRRPVPSYADQDSDDQSVSSRAVSRANRRRTIADLPLPTEEPLPAARSASRRMSIASSVGSVSGDKIATRAPSVAAGRRSVTPAPGLPVNVVQVKKARTAAPTSRIPKNPPPMPRVPSGYLQKSANVMAKEKENDIDQLTTGLKRITLKMPSKEEYEAKEKQKIVDAEKKAVTKTTTRKAPTARTKSTKPTITAKKPLGRPPKSSKPPSPAQDVPMTAPVTHTELPPAAIPSPEPPQIQSAVTLPLEQPQPIQPEQPYPIIAPLDPDRRSSTVVIQPPTELKEITITPEQLPKPSFMTVIDPLPLTTSPLRPDTPPPPPPTSFPGFVHYSKETFSSSLTDSTQAAHPEPQAALQWMPPNADAPRPVSPASKRQDLPVFTANGMIPFASNPNTASTANGTSQPAEHQVLGATTKPKVDSKNDIWEVETPAR
ncbi:Arginase/deacetylase [Lophiostoma macrostomum CBS 122681]|uniref:Arginase/deacetylase n=1 Tax=Lophiostoma macrostomum CBS 122681 TaxID=1314788 RepID=A0A6A6TVD6_9PLEO|nr:Arginase/deacetylase [Lophiostoma macrostomum CBS 122681]